MRHARGTLTAVVVIAVAAGSAWASSMTDPNLVKWSQPPIRLPEAPEYIYGWDEPSTVDIPIAADDWQCLDPRPVTGVHWWGSFPEIQAEAPVQQPDGFLITFWTDVPPGEDPAMPWSHPRDPIHTVDARNFVWDPAGYDVNLDAYIGSYGNYIIPADDAFQYNVTFDGPDYFHQELNQIYWLSIQAYWDDPADAEVWGWKTREWFWGDDGVTHDGTMMPGSGGSQKSWEEIIGPDDESWDLAFELSVPEPATMVLLSVGGVAALFRRRRRRRRT